MEDMTNPSLFFVQNFYGTDYFGDHGAGFRKKREINKEKFKLVGTEATIWWRKWHNEKLHDSLLGNTVTRINKTHREMVGTCDMHGREDVRTRGSNGKTSRKEPTWMT